MKAATGFIDVSKCYETVDLRAAHEAVVREGWPKVIADLVFQQYAAERRVKVAGGVSQGARVGKGIVAGCGFAVYALAAFMRPVVRDATAGERDATVRTYVDDIRIDVVSSNGAAGTLIRVSLLDSNWCLSALRLVEENVTYRCRCVHVPMF